ncbi:helix-turn-helix transcriptional regulator [Arenicella xantha]|uniref:Regulatory LuxR family protein n=1 Tax=Arenicella xantha TaxID=644221 RepID=A0A395JJA2_9GAMM|nr:LuxR family transcriptional regulator [Arenicella xantha]RBP49839.1 regulatory LuxR family protein [Arenicella xantha]
MNTQLNSVVSFSRRNPSLMPLPPTHQRLKNHNNLNEIEHLPTPSFLVDLSLLVIASNRAAQRLLDHNIVSLSGSTLQIGDSASTQQIKFAAQRMAAPISPANTSSPVTEQLYLDLNSTGLRTVTVAKTDIDDSHFLISIAGDLGIDSDQRIPCKRMQQFAKTFALSKCETRVIALMVQGQKPKQIAYTTNISVHTVRSHLRALYAKMQVRDFNDALILAVRLLAGS